MHLIMRATAPVLAIIMMVAMWSIARAQSYVIDHGASDALTRDLHLNSLPMVTAQFSASAGGTKQLILTGFVATPFGRHDAERIATAYLNDPSVNIVDQILIDPHVEDMRTASPGSAAAPGSQSSNSPDQLWNKTMQGIYKNGAQSPPASGPMLP